MRLSAFASTSGNVLAVNQIAADAELVRDIQGQLGVAGLLDPPADGVFGPVSQWALSEFCINKGLSVEQGLTPPIAAALIEVDADAVYQLNLANDLASKIVGAMQRRGYWLTRHPKCMNIVYVEGVDTRGRANANEPNKFNDVRFSITIADGRPTLSGAWEGTTEPGRYYTEHPMDRLGAARIAFGQYKSWIVGTHHSGQPGAHEALVQVEDVTVYRDLDRNYLREGDILYTGVFAINQHWGYDLPPSDLGRSSAGCLIGRTKDGHREFMRLAKNDARFKSNKGYRFMTAVLPAVALSETQFDPSSPH